MVPHAEVESARRRARVYTALVGTAMIASLVAFGAYLARVAPAPPPAVGEGATLLPVPLELPEFSLVDQDGVRFDRDRLAGRWTLAFFGYTYCPDVCPDTLQSLAPVLERLPESPATQVVFVSVDPERDTPARMKQYVVHFHPRLLGVTGVEEEIERLTRALGAFHRRSERRGSDGAYLVDHTASLFLIDPRGRLQALLEEPDDPDAFVDLLARVQSARRVSG